MKVPAILLFVAVLMLATLAAIEAFAQGAALTFEVAVVKPGRVALRHDWHRRPLIGTPLTSFAPLAPTTKHAWTDLAPAGASWDRQRSQRGPTAESGWPDSEAGLHR